MVKPAVQRVVRIYIEGGSTGPKADNDFRRGWRKFLNEIHELSRQHGYQGLDVVRGLDRGKAHNSFVNYKKRYPNDLCVLLIDAEGSVPREAVLWDFIRRPPHDHWEHPDWATEEHLYLMVPFVETWLITDKEALERYFGQKFIARLIPVRQNLEEVAKEEIDSALKRATHDTKKGPYHHGQAHEIIEITSPEKVKSLYHGNRLFTGLSKLIRNS